MDEKKTPKKESIDQSAPKSEDQPEEKSQDQPEKEVEEVYEDENSELIEIDGEEYTAGELKELVSKGKDYTKKTQELAEERRRYKEQIRQPKVEEEDTEIKQAKATLKKYNVAFAEEVDEKIRKSQIQSRLDAEFEVFKRQHNLSPEIAALVRVAGNAYNIPYAEAYRKYWGNKSVEKKSVGIRKVASNLILSRDKGEITRETIAKMTSEEYDKLNKTGVIDRLIASGELK